LIYYHNFGIGHLNVNPLFFADCKLIQGFYLVLNFLYRNFLYIQVCYLSLLVQNHQMDMAEHLDNNPHQWNIALVENFESIGYCYCYLIPPLLLLKTKKF